MTEQINYENGGLEEGPGNPYPDPGVSAEGFEAHPGEDSRPVNEIFRDRLDRMSPHEARQFEDRYLGLTDLYQGPGGP